MRVIIAGSRGLGRGVTEEAIRESGFRISEVVSGGASGPDYHGVCYALRNELPHKVFPARWRRYGKSAGPIRNRDMAEYADALIAAWDGESKGTKNMIEEAEKRGLRIYVKEVGS